MREFILLHGIWPLKSGIRLLAKDGIELDNPRSQREIEFVQDYIRSGQRHDEIMKSVATLQKKILKNSELRALFSNGHTLRPNAVDIAKNWLIVRFDDGGFFKKAEEERENHQLKRARGEFWFERVYSREAEGFRNFDKTVRLLHILNFFYAEHLSKSSHKKIFDYDRHRDVGTGYMMRDELTLIQRGAFNLLTVGTHMKEIEALSRALSALSGSQLETVQFIGETLDAASESTAGGIKLLLYASVMELLLTHIPRPSDPDDSISKQLQVKGGFMINKATGIDFDEVRKNIKTIYDARSVVAHGKFQEMRGENVKTEAAIRIAYEYVGVLTLDYIRNPKLYEQLRTA